MVGELILELADNLAPRIGLVFVPQPNGLDLLPS